MAVTNVPSVNRDTLARLTDYAAEPRGNRSGRTWTVDELAPLLDRSAPVAAIAERMNVTRSVVTYELIRMRRAGFPVPDRPARRKRSPRAIAIEDDLRSGLTDAETARRHGVGQPWVREIRLRAGIPPCARSWTDDERQLVIDHQRLPVHEAAALVGRSVFAVYGERRQLIAAGRIRAKTVRPRRTAG